MYICRAEECLHVWTNVSRVDHRLTSDLDPGQFRCVVLTIVTSIH